MIPIPLRHDRAAFTLSEILVALGLFAIVVIALLALFPVALRSEKESAEETRATLIASAVMDSITPDGGHGMLRLTYGMSNGLPLWKGIPFGTATNLSVAYNASCEPMRSLSTEEAALPLPDHEAAAVVTLSLIVKKTLPDLMTVEVAVASPASAPATGRSTLRYVRQVSLP